MFPITLAIGFPKSRNANLISSNIWKNCGLTKFVATRPKVAWLPEMNVDEQL